MERTFEEMLNLSSLYNNIDFISSTRFQRYIKKYQKVIKDYMNLKFNLDDSENDIKNDTLADYIRQYIAFYLYDSSDELYSTYKFCHNDFCDLVQPLKLVNAIPHSLPKVTDDTPETVSDNIISLLCSDNINSVINFEIMKQAIIHVQQYSYNNKIDNDNYFLSLPEDSVTILSEFQTIINNSIYSFERLYYYNYSVCNNDIARKIELNELNKIYNILEKFGNNFAQLVDVSKIQNGKIESLENAILSEKNTTTEEEYKKLLQKYENLQQKNLELERQNKKLKSKYDALNEKYLNLVVENTKQINEQKKLSTDKNKKTLKLNKNGRYLFLIGKDVTFGNSIKKVFPNSITTMGNINLSEYKIDAVIIFINKVSHSNYYPIKNQCKRNNIPLCHCPYSNIDKIKDTMELVLVQKGE